MKKCIIACCVLVGVGNQVVADFDVSFHGNYDFQGVYRKQKDDYVTKVYSKGQASPNQRKAAFNSYAENSILFSQKEGDFTYGANLNMDTYTEYNNKYTTNFDRTYMFFENFLGKMELGSNFSAATLLTYGAHSVASATGGASNGDWGANIYDPTRGGGSDSYSNYAFQQWIDITYLLRRGDDNPIKMSYFTPKIWGFQFGASYVPDTANVISLYNENVDKTVEFKNLISLAGRYDFKVGKDSEAGFSIAYNRAGSDLDQDYDHDEDYDGLSEIVFGARGSIDNFSFAGSYSDAKHFGQTLSRNNVYFNEYRNKFYTLGVAYSLGGASTSLTYIHQKLLQGSGSNVPVDITKAVSFGVDYVLFEGVKAYAEVTRFSIINSWYQIVNSKPKNTGTVGLVGTKIKI